MSKAPLCTSINMKNSFDREKSRKSSSITDSNPHLPAPTDEKTPGSLQQRHLLLSPNSFVISGYNSPIRRDERPFKKNLTVIQQPKDGGGGGNPIPEGMVACSVDGSNANILKKRIEVFQKQSSLSMNTQVKHLFLFSKMCFLRDDSS